MNAEVLTLSPALPRGPVKSAWALSIAIHGLALAVPVGLALRDPAPAPALQVRMAVPQTAAAVQPDSPAPKKPVAEHRPAEPSVPTSRAPTIVAEAAEPAPAPAVRVEAPSAPVRSAEAAPKEVAAERSERPPVAPVATAPAAATTHVPPRFDAAYLDNPPPAYPLIARRRGEQGTVIVSVDVGTDGRPQHCALHRSSGFPALDEAALKTIRTWRFVPARRGEQTVAETVLVPMPFRLTEAADAGRETIARSS
jgi:protein TonB